jgi:hypothetical protein
LVAFFFDAVLHIIRRPGEDRVVQSNRQKWDPSRTSPFPGELENAITEFSDYDNYRGCHEAIDNLIPSVVFFMNRGGNSGFKGKDEGSEIQAEADSKSQHACIRKKTCL